MGAMTLANFQAEIQSCVGDRGSDTTRLTRWLNFGYLDVAGAIDFEEFNFIDTSQSTVIGTQSVNIPAGSMVVQFVRNTTGNSLLAWLPRVEFQRRPITPTGTPTHWTTQGTKILLNPTPSAIVTLAIGYKKPPTLLAVDADATSLPDVWDPAIYMMAVHHALLALGEEQRASAWFNRAAGYIQSRMTQQDLIQDAAGLGASIPMGLNRFLARQLPPAPGS